MIKLLIDFIQFLYSTLPLFLSVAVFALLAIALSKSIKKHATIYYIVLSIPFFLVAIPFVLRLFDIESFSFNRLPFLGEILRDYIHMGTLGFPLLIIIMYTGALDPKIGWVKKLLNIRKELSIISGFPVLTHSLIRVMNNFPNALKFFVDNEGYMSTTKVTNELGAGITSFSFVLGVLMLALFLPLWITSFKSIHKRMGNAKWKKLQKWSYVLYAMLFIHAMGIQVGYLLNPRGGGAAKPTVETTAVKAERQHNPQDSLKIDANAESLRSETKHTEQGKGRRGGENSLQAETGHGKQGEVAQPARGGRVQSKGFSDIKVSSETKRYIHIVSLILIFGSYLCLRLRKAKKDAEKKK